ncbi:MAG: hypothetical protein ACOY5Y_08230 [Pseudomonadota bacterium]
MADTPPRHFRASGLWAVAAAVVMIGWVSWNNRAEDTDPSRPAYDAILGSRGAGEEEVAGRLLREAREILTGPEFRANLLALEPQYPAVYARDAEQAASTARIAGIVALEPFGSRFAPAQVEIVDGFGSALGAAGEGAVSGRYADIILTRPVLAAYASDDLVARSCAINVAAHEYAHTIVLTPVGFGNAFTDTTNDRPTIANRRDPSTPVASYLIGSVAQCTWLERRGRIGRRDVPACVRVFGVQAFNWDRCPQFTGGAPVAPREGLAPPAPGL